MKTVTMNSSTVQVLKVGGINHKIQKLNVMNATYLNKFRNKKKKFRRITQEEYDSFHNYNIESNSIDRDRE